MRSAPAPLPQAFLQETSSYEGADASATSNGGEDIFGFNAVGFLQQLSSILGAAPGGAEGAAVPDDDSDESSGFYTSDASSDESSDGDEVAEQAAPARVSGTAAPGIGRPDPSHLWRTSAWWQSPVP